MGLPEISKHLVYDEPTVMWRMWRADGLSSHAVIVPRGAGAACVWYLNDRPVGSRDFSDWSDAIRYAERMQDQNWSVGWRLV